MKNSIFNFELILVPIFDQNKWLLIAVQVEKKCLTIIDPLFGERENWIIYFINFLNIYSKVLKIPFNQNEWMILEVNEQHIFRNQKGSDSAIIAVLLAQQLIKQDSVKNLPNIKSAKKFLKKYLTFKNGGPVH